jgi:hypothetical protein
MRAAHRVAATAMDQRAAWRCGGIDGSDRQAAARFTHDLRSALRFEAGRFPSPRPSTNDGGKVADVANPPTKARNVLPQFAGTDRLRELFHDAPERMSDIAAFNIRPVQHVLATLMEFRDQACRDEN